MGAACRLRLLPRLFLCPPGDRTGPEDSSRQASFLAVAAGSATPGTGSRAPGKADPGRRFALLSIAAVRQLAFVRVDQQHPVDSSGIALFWRDGTAQVDCPGNAGAHGGG